MTRDTNTNLIGAANKKKGSNRGAGVRGKNADDTLGKAETYVRTSTRKRHTCTNDAAR